MGTGRQPVCITCGQPVASAEAEINRLPSGEACPACRDRLLDEMPPLLPSTETPARPTEEVELRGEELGPADLPPDGPIRA